MTLFDTIIMTQHTQVPDDLVIAEHLVDLEVSLADFYGAPLPSQITRRNYSPRPVSSTLTHAHTITYIISLLLTLSLYANSHSIFPIEQTLPRKILRL